MISVADFGHVTGRHEQHTSCRQAAVALEEEDRHEGRLSQDPMLLLGELCWLDWNQPGELASLFVFCFRGIISHEKPLLLIERSVGELRTYDRNGAGGVLKQTQHAKQTRHAEHSPYLQDVSLYDNRTWTTDDGTDREGPRASTRRRQRVM